jgi:hypothetical protein
MPRMFIESKGASDLKKKEGKKRVCRLLNKGTSRSCRFACIAFNVYRYMFGRVLNRGFMNPHVQYSTRDSLHETLFNSLNKSKGSQRAPCGGESFIVRVDGFRSILNAYDAGKEIIWIHLGFR